MPHYLCVRVTPENPSGRRRVRTLARSGVWALHRADPEETHTKAGVQLTITHVPTGMSAPEHMARTPKQYREQLARLGKDLPEWGAELSFGQGPDREQERILLAWRDSYPFYKN